MTFKRGVIGLGTLVAVLALSACASGPKYSVASSSFPAPDASKGRIYFYRPSAMGAAVQPDIKLNGEKVGTAKPHGLYFVDRAPGNYEVTASTETEKKLTFVLESGQERYVRLKIQMGILVGRIVPELVDKTEATEEMKELSYIAEPLK